MPIRNILWKFLVDQLQSKYQKKRVQLKGKRNKESLQELGLGETSLPADRYHPLYGLESCRS